MNSSHFYLAEMWPMGSSCSDETCPTKFCRTDFPICGCNDDLDCKFEGSVQDDTCLRNPNSPASGMCGGNQFLFNFWLPPLILNLRISI